MANSDTITNVLTVPLTVKYGFTVILMLLYLHNEQIKLPELLMNRMSKPAKASELINSNVSYRHPRVKTTNLCRLNASERNSISPRTVGAIQRQSYCVT